MVVSSQARRLAGIELFQEAEALAGDLIDGMAGGRLVVPGGEEQRGGRRRN